MPRCRCCVDEQSTNPKDEKLRTLDGRLTQIVSSPSHRKRPIKREIPTQLGVGFSTTNFFDVKSTPAVLRMRSKQSSTS